MLGVLPNSVSLLTGLNAVFAEAGWQVERTHERSCRGTLSSESQKSHTVVFARPDGAMQLLRSLHAHFAVLGLDKLYESSGGCRPSDCAIYNLPHISRQGLPTEVVLFSKKYHTLFSGARIATEYPNITERYINKVGQSVVSISVSGSAEVLVAVDAADFGVAINETGNTLRQNGLQVVVPLLTTSVVLVCKKGHTEANEFCERVSKTLCPAL